METIKHKLNADIYIPQQLKGDLYAKNICFLDIETTGLSSKYNEIILIGALCLEDGYTHITQFFANHIDKEEKLLDTFREFLTKFEYIITYNGNSFDLPFLRKKLEYYNLSHSIDQIPHLDLLRLVRKNKDILKLENCRLKTVEKSLGIYREDTISGRQSVDLYKDYMYSKDQVKKNIILKHNYDDIYYLPQLLSIYDIIEAENTLSLDYNHKDSKYVLKLSKENITFNKNLLSIKGFSAISEVPPQVYYKDSFSLNWDTSLGDFNIELKYNVANLSSGEKCFYIDLSDNNIKLNYIDKLSYNIADNILLLNIDNKAVYSNILSLLSGVISSLF